MVIFPWLLIAILSALAVGLGKLTPVAGVAGGSIAAALWLGCGWAGLALLGTFFVLGVLATAYRQQTKERAGLREGHGGRRTAVQVWANGGVAGVAGLLHWWQPAGFWPVVAASALSAATADTLASELGNVLGTRYFDLRTFGPGARGQDGVISLEGTACGFAGSLVLGLVALATGMGGTKMLVVVLAAGTFGNLLDSLLGAWLQRKGFLSNDAVNALNTLGAALFAWLITA